MDSNIAPVIGIISPCHNEEEVLPETISQLNTLVSSLIDEGYISNKSFIAFIDDGSSDRTWDTICIQAKKNPLNKGLKLAGNVGHQNALIAGLLTFNDEADALISIDADLQDDISIIPRMIEKFKLGTDVIYGVRESRTTDTFFKRNTALLFYKFTRKMKVNLVYNHADYRLCSHRVIIALSEFNEVNLFIRGIIPSIGFKSDIIYYNRLQRFAGNSKYPLKKMLSFAWNGITSFSNYPLRVVSTIGFFIFLACIAMSIYALLAFYYNTNVPGWVSTVLPMYFLGGIQLFCFGIIGEYIGKIYSEVKQRPRYFIDKRVN